MLESDGFAEVIISLFGGRTSIPFNITFSTRDGTAFGSLVDDADFINTAKAVTFAPSEHQKIIKIPIINDLDLEDEDESFIVELSGNLYVLLGQSQIRVTIKDDDSKPLYSMQYSQICIDQFILQMWW